MLTTWMHSVDELRAKYDWLLFFSVPKLLLLYHLLQAEDPNVDAIMHEISFLCSNERGDWKGTRVEVKVSRSEEDVGEQNGKTRKGRNITVVLTCLF